MKERALVLLILFFSVVCASLVSATEDASLVASLDEVSPGETVLFSTVISDADTDYAYYALDIYCDDEEKIKYVIDTPADTKSFTLPTYGQNYTVVYAQVDRVGKNGAYEYDLLNLTCIEIPVNNTVQPESQTQIEQTLSLIPDIILIAFIVLVGSVLGGKSGGKSKKPRRK